MRKSDMTDQEADLLNKSGLYITAAPVIEPMLERKRNDAIAIIVQRYHSGQKDFLAEVSQLVTVIDLEEEFKLRQKQIKLLKELK